MPSPTCHPFIPFYSRASVSPLPPPLSSFPFFPFPFPKKAMTSPQAENLPWT